MIERFIKNYIKQQLLISPAVAILGPRQVGKTTLTKQIAKEWQGETIYLDLERPSDQAKIAEPELYLGLHKGKLLIVDEIQRMPQLFQILRGVIDQRREEGFLYGQFLLLGSASLDLVQNSSESLAGRISYIDLGIINLLELNNKNDVDTLWLRGGFPNSLLASSDEASYNWRENFIMSYLERDIPALGSRMPAETMRRFWIMLAHNQGQPINASKLASNLGLSVPTIIRYLDLLVDLLLVRKLLPWSGNIGKRLVKSPKIYIRDTGLVHSLLNIRGFEELMSNPVIGNSWEGFVIENLLMVAPRRAIPMFYNTISEAEIDLVLEISQDYRIAFEIKRTLTPKVSKGFLISCETLNIKERYIIYPGEETILLPQNVKVLPLKSAMEMLLQN